ncbi:MAG: MerR family transcriptional regulator [Acidimicrobiales bacterium]|nr:MerR family transcriptional regulator [Acidimicrobiales bacterium]
MDDPPGVLGVGALAAAAEVSVDTVRYYQHLGLLEPPRRDGRRAVYGPSHLARMGEIRRLAAAGFTLDQIRQLAEPPPDGQHEDGLRRLAADDALARSLTRGEVADRAGVPESLVALLCDNGLLQPVTVGNEPRFDENAVSMVRAGLAIAAAGVPLENLVSLAGDHAANVTGVVDRAIALFEEHVKGTPGAESDEELTEVVRALLPPVTRLVAQHFHRSLVTRALERVADGDRRALADALVAADAENLVVTCEWR